MASASDRSIKESAPYSRVHIVSYRRKKLDKFDNLPFGMKEIIPDNLIKEKLIMDDDDKFCDITCEQVIIGKGETPRTVIKLGHNGKDRACENKQKSPAERTLVKTLQRLKRS